MLHPHQAFLGDPGAIGPEDYARWSASAIGAMTEQLEEKVIFDLAGDLHGRMVFDVGCGDGMESLLACE